MVCKIIHNNLKYAMFSKKKHNVIIFKVFRQKLCEKFSSCIGVKDCLAKCGHKFKRVKNFFD